MRSNKPTYLHYRASFYIEPTKALNNEWKNLITEIKKWVIDKTSENQTSFEPWFYQGGVNQPWIATNGTKIKVAVNTGDQSILAPEFWAVKLEEPCNEYPEIRRWTTDIGISILRQWKFEFSIIVSYNIKPGYIGNEPPVPVPTTPNIVLKLLTNTSKWHALAGGMPLTGYPIPLKTDMVPLLIDSLESPRRLFPIVYVSRHFRTGETLVDTQKLANVLAGNALVFVAESAALDKKIKDSLPPNFRCWNGMIRVYRPEVDFVSEYDSRRHRFFTANDIERDSPENVIKMLVKGISRRQIQWKKPKIGSLDDVLLQDRIQKIAELSSDKDKTTAEDWLNEIEKLLSENEKLKSEIDNLEERITEKEDELASKDYEKNERTREIENARNSLKRKNSKIEAISNLAELPKNLTDVVELIETIHPENIVFTEQAKKSAKSASWVSPDVAWSSLWSTATILHDLFFGEVKNGIDIEKEYKIRTGFGLAMTEGKQTKRDQKFLRLRKIDYEGGEINIEPHIKYGRKKPKLLRVYFCPHNKSKRIIVGHCGGHLDNYSSRSRK
jgi:hypothetical protein